MSAPDWLIARPIAHRGLHDSVKGIVENSRAAAQAAIASRFAIECDVEVSSDGEAFVFHDSDLGRLTDIEGPVAGRGASSLAATRFRIGGETLPSFSEFLAVIAGAVPLICEIKSDFAADFRLADRIVALASDYNGPLALKSFDPEIIAHLRSVGVKRPLGIVAEASYDSAYFSAMSPAQKQSAAAFLHIGETRPDFLSWSVDDLPHATPNLLRTLGSLPVLTWTVRTKLQKQKASLFADQIVFEGDPV